MKYRDKKCTIAHDLPKHSFIADCTKMRKVSLANCTNKCIIYRCLLLT